MPMRSIGIGFDAWGGIARVHTVALADLGVHMIDLVQFLLGPIGDLEARPIPPGMRRTRRSPPGLLRASRPRRSWSERMPRRAPAFDLLV